MAHTEPHGAAEPGRNSMELRAVEPPTRTSNVALLAKAVPVLSQSATTAFDGWST